jgi:Protein of unknown function (DUF2778)
LGASGDVRCHWLLGQRRRGVKVGEVLVGLGVRTIPLGIAAVVLGFIVKSPGTQADPTDIGLRGPGLSVFGTIHPDIFRLQAPLGSGPLAAPIRLASLEAPVGSDAPSNRQDLLTDLLAPARRGGPSDEPPASFDQRFASIDESPVDESLGSAMRQLAGGLQPPADRDIATAIRPMQQLAYASPDQDVEQDQSADAPPVSTVSNPDAPPEQTSQDSPDDDSRTAIYDITGRAVYMPDGSKLEAHSGIGDLMDNPRHVRVRMRGATPPNVYKLSLRGALFHGVRALRLTPLDERKMFGRDGMLAHSYLLARKGQSHGCVVFSNYPAFLNAFLKGEVKRLVVVERLETPPGPKLASGSLPNDVKNRSKASDDSRHLAAAGSH